MTSPTTTGHVINDPPAADLKRLLSIRRTFPLNAEVSTVQLSLMWGCSQLMAQARLARLNRLELATVRRGSSPESFYVLPRGGLL